MISDLMVSYFSCRIRECHGIFGSVTDIRTKVPVNRIFVSC